MPNTLGHLGVQGVATRALIRDADLKWICAGAVVPDVPWILQRAATPLIAADQAIALRLYVIVQASLAWTLLLAGCLALISAAPGKVFRILSLGAVIHLLLDATQIHWGNGVHLFAPLSWRLTRFGLYWPESAITLALTALGLLFVAYAWLRSPGTAIPLARPGGRAAAGFVACLAAYFVLPLALLDAPLVADNHSLGVLHAPAVRVGREIELDRAPYTFSEDGDTIEVVTRERLTVRGLRARRSGPVSIRGRFTSRDSVDVFELHEHWRGFRDAANYLGLILVAAIWVVDLGRRLKR